MIAQVPIAKFEQSKLQGLLMNRLLHRCLDITLASLKDCATTAQSMLDPGGSVRSVRTFLAAYIADLPEQQALSCITTNFSPSSMAGPGTLGDSAAHPLRRGEETLETIENIIEELAAIDARCDLEKHRKIAKTYGLNGVDKPFWRDWLFADPSLFLAPDALHQWHKFFMDHPIEWAKAWLGAEELDRRLSVLQPRVGFRHFRNGFTRFRQHTGKETKDLERVFLGVIAGHENITRGIMEAMRGFLDFIYLAQYESHSTETLGYLEEALRKFHRYKHHISESGVRSGPKRNGEFHIPKIELMHHVKRLIELLGSAPQFSSEQTERCHIDMAKTPYKATNRKDYAEQMCRYLDRRERVRLFSALTEWHSEGEGAMLDSVSVEQQERAFRRLAGKFLPISIRDVYKRKNAMCSGTTAFQLRQTPNITYASIDSVQDSYNISNLRNDLRTFFLGDRARQDVDLPFSSMSTWERMRVQLKDPQDAEIVMPPLTIEASPQKKVGNNKTRAGRYNFVLLHQPEDTSLVSDASGPEDFGIRGALRYLCQCIILPSFKLVLTWFAPGCVVAQLKMIFVPNYLDGQMPRKPFAYVQPLKFPQRSRGMTDDGINMYSLVRSYRSNNSRKGLIVPLDRIWRPVELIPKFGRKCDQNWTCDTAVEVAKEFYLNCFSDKSTYIEVY